MQRVFSDERTLENGTVGLINMACLIRIVGAIAKRLVKPSAGGALGLTSGATDGGSATRTLLGRMAGGAFVHRWKAHLLSGDDVLALQLHHPRQLRIGAGKLVVALPGIVPVSEVVNTVLTVYRTAVDACVERLDGAVGRYHCWIVGLDAVALFNTEHDDDSALLH
jgi:hypothetical protein